MKNVSAGYPERMVLSDISLAVHEGECLAIIGPNGSGKSTLLNVLARQIRPAKGSVHLFSEELWKQSARWAAQRIALTRNEESAEWPMTVEELVALGRSPHRGWVWPLNMKDCTIIDRVLEKTGLTALRKRPADQLSDGERQRVTLARALAQEPKMLLLDEPTANLDLKYQLEILTLTKDWAKCGLAVVAAIHDLTLAGRWADRIAVIRDGRLLKVGTVKDVLTTETIREAYGVHATIIDDSRINSPIVVPWSSVP